ncbi:hypothetical protein [Saccharicrinis carchari]|nr:hypothetical protein [Saccharicrinis carchari]
MLEHQKKVLLGLAKNPYQFRKEIIKSFGWLNREQAEDLYNWVKKEMGSYYTQLVHEALYSMSA